MMRHLIVFFIAAGLLIGCASQQQTRMTTTGAAVGAAAGAAIGSQSNRTTEGAILGGVLGAAAGMILAEPTRNRGQRNPQYQQARPVYQQQQYGKANEEDDD